jgi:hypothetical protein
VLLAQAGACNVASPALYHHIQEGVLSEACLTDHLQMPYRCKFSQDDRAAWLSMLATHKALHPTFSRFNLTQSMLPCTTTQGDVKGAALTYAQGLRYLVWTTFKTLDNNSRDLPGWTYELQVGGAMDDIISSLGWCCCIQRDTLANMSDHTTSWALSSGCWWSVCRLVVLECG